MNRFPSSHGIVLKKKHGQNFLRDQSVIDHMLAQVALSPETSVFEIGCGDGFLTRSILQTSVARLWVFEIDHEWAEYVKKTYGDPRMEMHETNILDVDNAIFEQHAPWTLLANLPYHVTFPILRKLLAIRALLKEGVIMVQEEVAQKIVATGGRGYGFPSLYYQHFFEWKLLLKIKPGSFFPAPQVDSRLLYLKPRTELDVIPHEELYWKFIALCFKQPRRTLKNNLAQSHYDLSKISDEVLALRAQQMSKQDFLRVWSLLNA